MKWSSGRCWTSHVNLLRYSDRTANAFMPTASRSITSALTLKSGGRDLIAVSSFILMTVNGCRTILTVLSLVALVARWSFGCARATEVIVGFWLVTTPCATTKDRSGVGMVHLRILRTARELRRDCSM